MSWLAKLFSKKEPELAPASLSPLKVDMHSHLIPGIDDGARNMDESIAMLAKFESLGYEKVITTPHIMGDFFKNNPEIINNGLKEVQTTAKQLGLKIQIEAAAEYYYDDSLTQRLQNDEKLLSFNDGYLLFEFPLNTRPDNIQNLIFEFQSRNYKPVLAHCERYSWMEGNLDEVREWRNLGVNIQVNYNSLLGHYGPTITSFARSIVEEVLVDFLASDCHRMEHLMSMEEGLTKPIVHMALALPLKNASLNN